jgi:uncharacterized membrane protein YhhN
LAAAAVVCAVNWWSRAASNVVVERITKPLATVLFLVASLTLDPVDDRMRVLFVIAFVWCLVGDVLLMLGDTFFLAGLVAFLAAHVLFTIGFFVPGGDRLRVVWLGIAVVVIGGLTVGQRIAVAAVQRDTTLGAAVVVYLFVISVMVLAASVHGQRWGIAGAISFAVSDAILGWDRFVGKLRLAPVLVMVTYHLALFGLVLALT